MRTDRTTFLNRYPDFTDGMNVFSKNGEKIGKVISSTNDSFMVEKGFFFPKDFTVRYDDISDIRDGSVYLNLDKSELAPWKDASYEGWNHVEGINTGNLAAEPLEEYRSNYSDWSNESINVPVVEEELEAQKTSRKSGEVRIRKIVHTELQHFTVPVTKESVRVDRVPVNEERSTRASESDFTEETINIPIMEEEVSITKRPVVKEEVKISKDQTTENQDVEGEVRKQEVKIERDDEIKRRKVG